MSIHRIPALVHRACRCYGEGYMQRMGKTRKMGGRTFRINMRVEAGMSEEERRERRNFLLRTSVGMHLLLRSSLLKSEPRAPAPIKAPRVVVIGPLASLSFSVFLYPPSFGYLLPNADRDPANLPRITSILPYRINYSRRVIPRAQLPMNIKQTNYIIAIDEIVLSTQSRITLNAYSRR